MLLKIGGELLNAFVGTNTIERFIPSIVQSMTQALLKKSTYDFAFFEVIDFNKLEKVEGENHAYFTTKIKVGIHGDRPFQDTVLWSGYINTTLMERSPIDGGVVVFN